MPFLSSIRISFLLMGYATQELGHMHELIDAYASAVMPFSPIEYPLSSRMRLVEDLRAKECMQFFDAQRQLLHHGCSVADRTLR